MMRFRIVALAIMASVPAMADEMVWSFRHGDGKMYLVREQPDTDDQVLGFVCDEASRRVTVFYNAAPADIRDGARMAVTFSSEGGREELTMRAREEVEIGGFSLVAETPMMPGLARVLADGRMLTVRVQNSVRQIPLAGVQAGVPALVRGCGG